MKNFAQAVDGADALGTKEMKNLKGGAGNCGFKIMGADGKPGRTYCGLEENQQSVYEALGGIWCCNNCSSTIGC